MKKFRHIGLIRVLPEYLLIFGLFFGGFSLTRTLAEAPLSHTEVSYIELLAEDTERAELELVGEMVNLEEAIPRAAFFSFAYRSMNQASLIHHSLALDQERLQNIRIYTHDELVHNFTFLHIPLYPRDDFSIALATQAV